MPKKSPITQNRELISSEPHEIKTFSKRFVNPKTGVNISVPEVTFLHSLMKNNLGKVKRVDLETGMGVFGFVYAPKKVKK